MVLSLAQGQLYIYLHRGSVPVKVSHHATTSSCQDRFWG